MTDTSKNVTEWLRTGLSLLLVAGLVGWSLQAVALPHKAETEGGRAQMGGEAIVLPWGDVGPMMATLGVIDEDRWAAHYVSRPEAGALLAVSQPSLQVTEKNADIALNLLWAYGLANKNPILTEGPMADPRYGSSRAFASTGGWTLGVGEVMNHYGAHSMTTLTPAQQELVERVAKGIYRPCCNNPVHFPDCNHGMAMLGALELLAADGATEEKMYTTALALNALWFPDTYETLERYFDQRGISMSEVDAQTVLSAEFSSAAGYKRVLSKVEPPATSGGGGCSI